MSILLIYYMHPQPPSSCKSLLGPPYLLDTYPPIPIASLQPLKTIYCVSKSPNLDKGDSRLTWTRLVINFIYIFQIPLQALVNLSSLQDALGRREGDSLGIVARGVKYRNNRGKEMHPLFCFFSNVSLSRYFTYLQIFNSKGMWRYFSNMVQHLMELSKMPASSLLYLGEMWENSELVQTIMFTNLPGDGRIRLIGGFFFFKKRPFFEKFKQGGIFLVFDKTSNLPNVFQ